MQFSAPIYALKRKAKLLARGRDIALHQALDTIAVEEGFRSWSHLVSSSRHDGPARRGLLRLKPGDLALIAARPGQGKTLLGLEMAARAPEIGRKGYFFTLDYHARDIETQLSTLGFDPGVISEACVIDTSDDLCAEHVIKRLEAGGEAALVVVDYLQLLDHKRINPSLDEQMRSLRRYLARTGAICAVISQIDRAFDLSGKSMPDISDIRLPNPFDLSVFGKTFFLHGGQVRFEEAP